MDSIRLVLSISTSKQWEVHHMYVKSVFLHGDLNGEIYMKNPKVFIHDLSLVCRLKKYLYGLNQAPRAWYAKMDNFLFSQGFETWKCDHNVYLQHLYDCIQIIVLYFYDIFITIICIADIGSIKYSLHKAFSMTDLRLLKQFLGLDIEKYDAGVKVIQSKYASDLLQNFKIVESRYWKFSTSADKGCFPRLKN